jgi:hypothetical protein
MTKTKSDAAALVSHEKDREFGLPVDDFGLQIVDVPTDDGNLKGGLRVVHLDREQMTPGKGPNAGSLTLTKTMESVLVCIRENPGIAGGDAVSERVQVRRATVSAAIKQLVADEKVVQQRPVGGGVRLFLKHMAPEQDLLTRRAG